MLCHFSAPGDFVVVHFFRVSVVVLDFVEACFDIVVFDFAFIKMAIPFLSYCCICIILGFQLPTLVVDPSVVVEVLFVSRM